MSNLSGEISKCGDWGGETSPELPGDPSTSAWAADPAVPGDVNELVGFGAELRCFGLVFVAEHATHPQNPQKSENVFKRILRKVEKSCLW